MVRKLGELPKFLVVNSETNSLENIFLLTVVRFYTDFYIFLPSH
jgi:hypothetical protein